jgi:uncharacterized protein (DUF2267 family)
LRVRYGQWRAAHSPGNVRVEGADMQHDEFIGLVQNRACLSSRGDAERASGATLETLAERVPEGLAGNLAA